jgi:Divergent InlB B-repeat domain
MRKIGGLWPLFLCGCGYLTIYMQTVPPNDPGRFNITIDGAVRASDQGNGGVLSQVKLSTGNHTIGQTAGTNTKLADYKTVISGDCDANGKTTISYADDKSCTITNTNARFLPSVGPQRTAIILVSAPDAPANPYANKANTASMFYASGNPKSARSYFFGASYGLVKITGSNPGADGSAADIYGPYVAADASCGVNGIALSDADVDFTKYDRLVVVLNNPKCVGGGTGQTKPSIYNTGEGPRTMTIADILNLGLGETTLNGKIADTTLHEYGHNLGMEHSGAWYCPSAAVAANGCHGSGVWDPMDLVSQGAGKYQQPNPVHKERMGWLSGARVQQATTGSYVLNVYEDGANNLKVLKIPRRLPNGAGWYYLSYHHPSPPFDDWLATVGTFANGVAVNIDERGGGFDAGLVDTTPGSNTGYSGYADGQDGALLVNQTLNDPLTGIAVTVTAVNANSATVSVTVPARATRFVQAAMEINNSGNIDLATVGTVSGGGSFNVGQMASLSATSQPGWAFSDWYDYDAGKSVSAANPYAFPVANDVVYTARFNAAPPPNDLFANAKPVTPPLQDHIFTASAKYQPGEKFPVDACGPGSSSGGTIWYTYTPIANQRLTIDTALSEGTANIAVYTGNALNALVPVPGGCDANSNGSLGGHVSFQATAGTTYRIQIDTAPTNIVVTFALAPANDDFAAAKALGALPAQDTAAMRGASLETSESAGAPCGQGSAHVSAWYSFTAAQTKSLVVSSSYGGAGKSSLTQPGIAVYTGAALGSLVPVGGGACNSNPNNAQADFTVPVTAGTTYRVRISHFRGYLDPAATTTTSFQLQ